MTQIGSKTILNDQVPAVYLVSHLVNGWSAEQD